MYEIKFDEDNIPEIEKIKGFKLFLKIIMLISFLGIGLFFLIFSIQNFVKDYKLGIFTLFISLISLSYFIVNIIYNLRIYYNLKNISKAIEEDDYNKLKNWLHSKFFWKLVLNYIELKNNQLALDIILEK